MDPKHIPKIAFLPPVGFGMVSFTEMDEPGTHLAQRTGNFLTILTVFCRGPPRTRQAHVRELERSNMPLRPQWVPPESKALDWGNGPAKLLFKKHGEGPSGFDAKAPEDMPLKKKHER